MSDHALQEAGRALKAARDVRIRELYEQGYTVYEIGERREIGMNGKTVAVRLRAMGVPRRKRGRSNELYALRQKNGLPTMPGQKQRTKATKPATKAAGVGKGRSPNYTAEQRRAAGRLGGLQRAVNMGQQLRALAANGNGNGAHPVQVQAPRDPDEKRYLASLLNRVEGLTAAISAIARELGVTIPSE